MATTCDFCCKPEHPGRTCPDNRWRGPVPFVGGQRVRLGNVRREDIRGQVATVLRFFKCNSTVRVLLDDGTHYRAFAWLVTPVPSALSPTLPGGAS